jgi:hypothetical protein
LIDLLALLAMVLAASMRSSLQSGVFCEERDDTAVIPGRGDETERFFAQ